MLSNTYDKDEGYQWDEEDRQLAGEATTAGILLVQDRLGITTGDAAAAFFSGDAEALEDLLQKYIRFERVYGSTIVDNLEIGDRVVTKESLPIADDFDGVPAGSTGVVVANDEEGLRIALDATFDCLAEWDNCLEAFGEECRHVLAAIVKV